MATKKKGKAAPRGAPTVLTVDMMDTIVLAIKSGNFIHIACAYVGVDRDLLSDWVKRGKERPGTIYADFARAIAKAQAEAQVSAIAHIASVGRKSDWRALQFIVQREDISEQATERAERHRADMQRQELERELLRAKIELAKAGIDPETGKSLPYFLPDLGKEPDGK